MNTPARPNGETAALLAALFTGLAALSLSAHELTRQAHESALDPHETKVLAKVQNLREVAASPLSPNHTCRLTLQLKDAATSRPVAGLVRIRRADGAAVPLPGLVNRGTKLSERHPGKDWFALIEPTTLTVPREMLTVEAFSGLETSLARATVNLADHSSARLDVALSPFSNAARNHWFGGNTHLHLSGLTRQQADEYLRTLPRADRLDLVFVSYLERAKADRDYISNGYTLADLQRLGGPGLLFGDGEEHRHNFEGFGEGYGHVMFLNLRQLVRPVSIGAGITGNGPDWPPLRRGILQARNDGATVIWCHNTFGHEDGPDWLAGLLDAHNIFDGGIHGTYDDTYYRYLNIGLKVPFSTGTDWFLYDFSRVYARVDEALNVPNWLRSVKAGRTFISNGPLLELSAGPHQIGDTIGLSSPAELTISGRAVGRHDFKRLELVHNGEVAGSAASRIVNGHAEAKLELRLKITEPGWIALRVPSAETKNEMGEPLFAHTSPIYVECDGKRIFRKESAQALVADMQSALKIIPEKAQFDNDAQRDEVLDVYRRGIETLRRRLSE